MSNDKLGNYKGWTRMCLIGQGDRAFIVKATNFYCDTEGTLRVNRRGLDSAIFKAGQWDFFVELPCSVNDDTEYTELDLKESKPLDGILSVVYFDDKD